jgi:hypothetical protein
MLTEAIAVLVVAPITFHIARSNPGLPEWQRNFLYGVTVATVLIDGYLFLKWVGQTKTPSRYLLA